MKWNNLKVNKCPVCNKKLEWTKEKIQAIFNCKCGFMISTKRMSEIINSQVKKGLEAEELEEKILQEEDSL